MYPSSEIVMPAAYLVIGGLLARMDSASDSMHAFRVTGGTDKVSDHE
jgi:hypothetical protein